MPIRAEFIKLEELGEQLEQSENERQKVLAFMEKAPCICFMKSATTGKYEFINAMGAKMIGRDASDIIGKTDWEVLPDHLARITIDHDITVLKGKGPVVAFEHRSFKNSDEKPALFLVLKFLVNNGDKSIGGLAITVPDAFDFQLIKELKT